jgi:integrase
MQRGTIQKHGLGYRGSWWEDGKRRTTKVCRTQTEAKRLLKVELDRLELGDGYRAPITLAELVDRFFDTYTAQPQTVMTTRRRLVRPLRVFGDTQASDITPEALKRFLARLPAENVGKSYRRDIIRTLRMVYSFGVDAGLVRDNPARKVDAPAPVRGERILPFESWAEVERVAEECGRWAPLVTFMADTGARPAEAVGVEHRHVDLAAGTVELPGAKTDAAWRTVHMTSRGVDAIKSAPRALTTKRVFHIDGAQLVFDYFRRDVWHPALELAGLEDRPPYSLRHTYAFMSLAAGVPIASLARSMGHSNVNRTFATYGGWVREMGADAAAMREAWAAGTIMEPEVPESGS